MSKDQAIGAAILVICMLIGVLYVATLFFPQWFTLLGIQTTEAEVRFWIVATPVLIAFIAVLAIGGWIGWTMATTPPPKPKEEITMEGEQKVQV
jgi:predicted DNA-binding transcriptional regulator